MNKDEYLLKCLLEDKSFFKYLFESSYNSSNQEDNIFQNCINNIYYLQHYNFQDQIIKSFLSDFEGAIEQYLQNKDFQYEISLGGKFDINNNFSE